MRASLILVACAMPTGAFVPDSVRASRVRVSGTSRDVVTPNTVSGRKFVELAGLTSFSALLFSVGALSETWVAAAPQIEPIVASPPVTPPMFIGDLVPAAAAAEPPVIAPSTVLLAAYDTALHEHALPTKAMTSSLIFGLANALSQTAERRGVDAQLIARMMLYGAAIEAPLQHAWHNTLEHALPGAHASAIVGKIALDQLAMAPVQLSVFLTSLAILSMDTTAADGARRVTRELTRVFKMHTCFWCVAHLVTFSIVPLEYRVLWGSCANIVYVALLSAMTMQGASKAEPGVARVPLRLPM